MEHPPEDNQVPATAQEAWVQNERVFTSLAVSAINRVIELKNNHQEKDWGDVGQLAYAIQLMQQVNDTLNG